MKKYVAIERGLFFRMDNKINVLYTMPGDIMGGGHLTTFEIMDQLGPYGFQPIALVNSEKSEIVALAKQKRIKYICVPNGTSLILRDFIKFFRLIFRTWRIIIRNRISLAHFNDLGTSHYGILAARLACVPSILHVRSVFWAKQCGWMNRLILSQANIIFANSRFVHSTTIQAGLPKEKIHTIYNGVDLTRFEVKNKETNRIRRELEISKDRLVLCFMGRLGLEWKNESLVYELVGELSQRLVGITCLVLGGPYDGEHKTFERCKINARDLGRGTDIRLLGHRNDIPEILSLVDILLVPSKEEPFGRVVLEGMAAGVTVVASNNGGIPEMIIDGHNGFLRSPDDLKGWLAIAESLLSDARQRERIGRNARKTIEDKFTLTKMAQKIALAYFDQLGITK
jgi:glycosyltransferase involved in cell wall biosynthesis